MVRFQAAVFAILICAASGLHAAVPADPLQSTLLKKPSERISRLRSQGPAVYAKLRNVAFDSAQPFQIRWRALMSMAWMGRKESVTDLETALRSKDWFMRDGALQALAQIDRNQGRVWARKLLADPALIVRTSAVNVIHKTGDVESEPKLWQELYNKINYRGTQSLWIRRHIVEALADLSTKGRELKFAAILDDPDRRLHEPAMRALEKLTGKKPGRTSRLFWKTWAKNHFQN